MGFIIFLFLIGFVTYSLMKRANQENIDFSPFEEERKKLSLELPRRPTLREKYGDVAYARLAFSPLVHREALIKASPVILLFLSAIVFTAIITQSGLATLFMVLICVFIFTPYFWFENMEARKNYNAQQEHETVVEREVADSNDFTIPGDWLKKYL